MNLLVTGSNGFVGRALCAALSSKGDGVSVAVRRAVSKEYTAKIPFEVGDINANTDWGAALEGKEAVFHLAARAHVMQDAATDPLAEYRRVNVEGTLNLARQAAAAGVQRFLFLSSIKVNGEATWSGGKFTAEDAPAPQDAYGISKMEAEQGLRDISARTGMAVVIIRPPLVYGPGVKANFATMMYWLARGVPLPLGAITRNRRSLVALDNLVNLVVTCLDHPAAINQTFLVSDGEDLSTADLLRRLGHALGRPAHLLPLPVPLLKLGTTLLGRRDIYHRLCGSLQVDISKTHRLLGWTPPVSVDEGLWRAARNQAQ